MGQVRMEKETKVQLATCNTRYSEQRCFYFSYQKHKHRHGNGNAQIITEDNDDEQIVGNYND